MQTARSNGNIFDLAVNRFGTIESALDLCFVNDYGLDFSPNEGEFVNVQDTVYQIATIKIKEEQNKTYLWSVKQGQTCFDLAVQLGGRIEDAFDYCLDGLDYDLEVNTLLSVQPPKNEGLTAFNYFKKNGLSIQTKIYSETITGVLQMEDGGLFLLENGGYLLLE